MLVLRPSCTALACICEVSCLPRPRLSHVPLPACLAMPVLVSSTCFLPFIPLDNEIPLRAGADAALFSFQAQQRDNNAEGHLCLLFVCLVV